MLLEWFKACQCRPRLAAAGLPERAAGAPARIFFFFA